MFLKHVKNTALATVFGALICAAPYAKEVKKITVKGNVRLEAEVVKSYITSFVGKDIDEDDISDDLRNLYETGRFENVEIDFVNDNLIIKVQENPYVNTIKIVGDEKAVGTAEVALKEIQLKERDIFSKEKLNEAIRTLRAIMRVTGYYQGKVSPKIERLKDNRINLFFVVDAGAQSRIREIKFMGANVFSESELKDHIDSKEDTVLNFMAPTKIYDPQRRIPDLEKLRRFYFKKGYLDFEVERTVTELSTNRRDFYITHYITEGERYKVTDVTYTSDIKELPRKKLLKDANFEKDEWYDESEAEAETNRLNELAMEKGFAFVDVQKKLVKDEKNHTVAVNFHVGKADKVYIEKIIIEGNYLTRDHVILREMLLHEGDVYNKKLLKDSIRNIRMLGFFEPSISEKELKGSAKDKVKILISLKEKPAASFSMNLSVPSSGGIGGGITLGHNNIAGTGVQGMVGFEGAFQKHVKVNTSVTLPHFIFPKVDFTVGGGYQYVNSKEQSDTYANNWDGSGIFSIPLMKDLSANIGYSFSKVDQHPLKSNESHSKNFADRNENYISSSVIFGFRLDKRDNPITPLSGGIIVANSEFAGLGGDSKFIKFTLNSEYNFRFGKTEMVLTMRGRGGYIYDFDKYIYMNDRFNMPAKYLRGIGGEGIGPREGESNKKPTFMPASGNGTSIGGTRYFAGSAEFSFSMFEKLGMRGFAFTDVGNLWGLPKPKTSEPNDAQDEAVWGESYVRWTAGAGLKMELPFVGHLNAGLAYPIRYNEKYDKPGYFFFSMGASF